MIKHAFLLDNLIQIERQNALLHATRKLIIKNKFNIKL